MNGDEKKKTYTETPFLTPEQRLALEQHMQQVMEKMKSCPAPATPNPAPATPSVDTSKCQMNASDHCRNESWGHGELCGPRGASFNTHHDPELREPPDRRVL